MPIHNQSIVSIKAEDVYAWINGNSELFAQMGQPFILDVRNHDELLKAKLNIAFYHIPMLNVLDHLHEIPKDKAIICMCHHGMRSASVAHTLLNNGFTNLYNLEGGIHAVAKYDNSIATY
jgi:rhodanese-related sulfurtransferase